MPHKHILLLTLHNPADFRFAEWLGDAAPGTLSLVVDRESVSDEALAALEADPAFGFVRAYPNYLNNGAVYVDVERLHAERPVTHVIAFGEDDVVRAARLRERWGLPGQRVDNAHAFRDKSLTRALLAEAGVPVHAGAPLPHPLALLDFVGEHGLPVYVKPRTSSGSVFGRKVATEGELLEVLETGFAPRIPYAEYVSDLCVETFHPGELFHVDGIALEGEVAWMWPSKYLTSGLEIRAFGSDVFIGSTMLGTDNPVYQPLTRYVADVCRTLALPHGHTFHAEVFVTADGEMSLCEIASRTGGGRIAEYLRLAGGPELNEMQFLVQSGALCTGEARKRLTPPHTLCGWALIPPQPGVCVGVPDFTGLAGVCRAKLKIRVGETGWSRSFSGDSMGHLIVSGDTEDEVRVRLREALIRTREGLRFQ
ncbi:MAG: hypothetical protein AVDCRST_MAG68-640 [uncultured Gemmatimonadetes bacterium]|uniref:ATP-grasp domain-containing protein n=1 Tax=uncultured Gemmatimonadota bacterium TaxID=203437 RepID=A0A6J4KFA5_9BACT|nr:MAG: hypothetical protein AVDCRST_MAG68-640 [uncultured Gemmatimonadota bacterium]